ncbi:Hsp70 family protein [Thaumasiovibrio sp. DFM-14]|uniref:Hsp70 family protein n=1 Tax=Thaumasiovibrio sp. DFM-14 TaxID=3384792 RepID=UPI0039A10016
MSSTTQYYVGIDLGTTNTVVAYSHINDTNKQINIFPIDQLIGPGTVARRNILPSFRYHPAAGEIAESDLTLPWQLKPVDGDFSHQIVGEWARELGSKVSGRQVTSAKSWLSHQGVDRNGPILPWAGASDVNKISPVVATASYLNHIHQCWNYHHGETPLAQQHVVLTVPASFDESARQLTLDAAKLAGLANVRLLEEPQAACYDWYQRHQATAKTILHHAPLILICDVGGGTTDFSLIAASTTNDELTLSRIGIGEHLMLGGDNIDLTLAHYAEQQISPTKNINAANLARLIQQTRKSKEQLLALNAPATSKITLLGRGSGLIGNSRSIELQRNKVQSLVLDGFMPQCELRAMPQATRAAVQTYGLPYASNPAISQHIAHFIDLHQPSIHQALGLDDTTATQIPSAVLFNGGFFNSERLKQATIDCIEQWSDAVLTELDNPHPDLAVARGAVCYSFARQGQLLKIAGGAARSYFLEVKTNQGAKQALALLARGSEEGQEFHLTGRQFALSLGQPIKFQIMTSNKDHQYPTGSLTAIDDSFNYLPPLIVTLDDEKAANSTQGYHEKVTLVSHYDELGLVKVECVSTSRQARWQLEFEVRQQNIEEYTEDEQSPVYDAVDLINQAFGNTPPKDNTIAKTLRPKLEQQLGQREHWDTTILRELATPLLAGKKRRRRSEQHEREWLKLTGLCLRPGFGAPADEWRMSEVWPLYQQGIHFTSSRNWADWWIFWRRICGGLNRAQQHTIFSDIQKYLQPNANRNKKLLAEKQAKGYEEMVRLAACLEKIDLDKKMSMIEWLFSHLEKSQYQQAHWWAVGRIASRYALCGEADKLMPATHTSFVLQALLEEDWRKEPYIAFAAVMMSRKTGDRNIDIDEDLRKKIEHKLAQSKCPKRWLDLVNQVKNLENSESQRLFGDSLPTGLTLIH